MFSYNVFRGLVIEKLRDYMPPEYSVMEMNVSKIATVNYPAGRDAISFHSKDSDISPVIYIDNLFKDYQMDEDIRRTLKNCAESYVAAMKRTEKTDPLYEKVNALSKDTVLDNVVYGLINTELNKELLGNTVHRDFNDLSIVYRVIIEQNSEGAASILVKNDFASKFGISEHELYESARDNTERLLGFKTININDEFEINLPPEESMYILTTENGANGAIVLLFNEQMDKLAETLNSDLMIIPSSTGEIIAVSATTYNDPESLALLVRNANSSMLELKDRLSNQIYMYSRTDRHISIVTDADKSLIYDEDTPEKDEILKRPFNSI